MKVLAILLIFMPSLVLSEGISTEEKGYPKNEIYGGVQLGSLKIEGFENADSRSVKLDYGYNISRHIKLSASFNLGLATDDIVRTRTLSNGQKVETTIETNNLRAASFFTRLSLFPPQHPYNLFIKLGLTSGSATFNATAKSGNFELITDPQKESAESPSYGVGFSISPHKKLKVVSEISSYLKDDGFEYKAFDIGLATLF